MRVAELLGVEVSVEDGVLLDVRVAELLDVPDRVAELLEVPVVLGVAEGLLVPEDEPVAERVEAGVCVALDVAVCVEVELPV